MTENEIKAIKWIKNVRDDAVITLDYIQKNEPNVSPMLYAGRKRRAETIVKMCEELERYREMGTVEELQELKDYKAKMEMQVLDDINNPLEPLKLSSALQSEIRKYERNKAIDVFFEELQKYEEDDDNNVTWLKLKMSSIYEIAEQVKAGEIASERSKGRWTNMALFDRIANYFKEWDGIDETAPKMESNINELRYIANMKIERCRLIRKLNETNLKLEKISMDKIKEIRNEAITEFVEQMKAKIEEKIALQVFIDEDDLLDKDQINKYINEIAEEMKKAGAE